MKILTFSTLFPNAARPSHGIFVETRLRQLVASGEVEAKVVAPVPWFPWTHARFGSYADFARAPAEETRYGIEVLHPRYLVVPRIGMTLAPFLLYRAALPSLRRLAERYPFDLIDAHYFYPDGVAAALLARRLRKPVVITARGTDLSLIPRYRAPRRMVQWAATRASGMITVAASLKAELVRLQVSPERVHVMRNGVDLELFSPSDRATTRAALGMHRTTLLSVGHLIERKGHDLVIRALADLPDAELVIAGDGPQREALEALARAVGVAARVRFVGVLRQSDLARYYTAADVLVLASSREGWANVLLEAMACGTPVVATDVGGSAEVVRAPAAGVLAAERTPVALTQALQRLLGAPPAREATRRYAEQHSWHATTRAQLELFRQVCAAPTARRGAATAVA
ncbi:MAG: glycosyltransferase family 4 protein [Betaproteobacteria bacterium]